MPKLTKIQTLLVASTSIFSIGLLSKLQILTIQNFFAFGITITGGFLLFASLNKSIQSQKLKALSKVVKSKIDLEIHLAPQPESEQKFESSSLLREIPDAPKLITDGSPVKNQITLFKDNQTKKIKHKLFSIQNKPSWIVYLVTDFAKKVLAPLRNLVHLGLIGSLVLISTNFGLVTQSAAIPDVELDIPANLRPNANFKFDVNFKNSGSTQGYGAFVDTIFPGSNQDNNSTGIDFVSSTYLGKLIPSTILTFPDSYPKTQNPCIEGQFPVLHPLFKNKELEKSSAVCGNPGHKLVVTPLPINSFEPNQPEIKIVFEAISKNTSTSSIKSVGGFYLGSDVQNNPKLDPPLVGKPFYSGISIE